LFEGDARGSIVAATFTSDADVGGDLVAATFRRFTLDADLRGSILAANFRASQGRLMSAAPSSRPPGALSSADVRGDIDRGHRALLSNSDVRR
jgi:hypothetical protein